MTSNRFMTHKMLKIFVLLSIIPIAASISGCTEKYESEYDPEKDSLVNPPEMFEQAPEDLSKIALNETFIISFRSSPNTLNPLFVSSAYDYWALQLVFDRLFFVDSEFNYFANPSMVDSWSESDDHRIMTIKLKEGLKWHDGESLTAEDLVFTMQMLKKSEVPAVAFKSDVENMEKVEALDELTVRYTFKKPVATRFDLVSVPYGPLPKHLFDKDLESNPDLKNGKYYQHLANNPIGNGPYKLVEWVENERLVFERWEDYPGKKPYLQKIIYRIIPDTAMALLAFKAGDIDAMYYLGAKQSARETTEDNKDFAAIGRKYVMSEWLFDYMGWNMDGSNPFFIDKKVRYAMAHAYNFELTKSKLYYNLVHKCLGCFHPDSWMFNKDIDPVHFDLKKAAQLLDEAGWEMADDGWRYKEAEYVLVEKSYTDEMTGKPASKVTKVFVLDGQEYQCKDDEKVVERAKERRKFEFTLLSTPSNGLPRATNEIYQLDLRKIGIDMKMRLLEWTSFLDRCRNHEMQAYGMAWGSEIDPDKDKSCWRTQDYEQGQNYGGYSNAEVDRLFEIGIEEFDQVKRKDIYQKIHKILYEDQPCIYIDNRVSTAVVHKRIRGLYYNNFGLCSNVYPFTTSLWVPKDEAIRLVEDSSVADK